MSSKYKFYEGSTAQSPLRKKGQRAETNGPQCSPTKSVHMYPTIPTDHESTKEKDDGIRSGNEFKPSKLSENQYAMLKKKFRCCQRKYNTFAAVENNKLTNNVSKGQSSSFKTYMTQAFNKFKETCSGFELHMEHVKWRYARKNLIDREVASQIINKCSDIITSMKNELDVQENQLVSFYESWNRNYDFGGLEDSSEFEDEDSVVVSECDSDEIFSESERSIYNADSRDIISPILGKKEEKKSLAKTKSKKRMELQRTENSQEITTKDNEMVDSVQDRMENELRTFRESSIETRDVLTEKSRDKEEEEEVTVSETMRTCKQSNDEECITSERLNAAGVKFQSTERSSTKQGMNQLGEMKNHEMKYVVVNTPVDAKRVTTISRTEIRREKQNDAANNSVDEDVIEDALFQLDSQLEIGEAEDQQEKKDVSANSTVGEEWGKHSAFASDSGLELAEESIIVKRVNGMSGEEIKQDDGTASDTSEDERIYKNATLNSDSDLEVVEVHISKEMKNGIRGAESEEENKNAASDSSVDDVARRVVLFSDLKSQLAGKAIVKEQKNEMRRTGSSQTEKHIPESLSKPKRMSSSVSRKNYDLSAHSEVYSCFGNNTSRSNDVDDHAENMLAKAALLVSSNSETSNSDNTNSLTTKSNSSVSISSQNGEENGLKRKRSYELCNSMTDTVKRRRINFVKNSWDADEKLHQTCRVVLEKLSHSVLKEHARALEKSWERLECKAIKRLIDLEQLERHHICNSIKTFSKSLNKKTEKETCDTLLDHLKRVECRENSRISDEEANVEHMEDLYTRKRSNMMSNGELLAEVERAIKNGMLNGSDSDIENVIYLSDSSHKGSEKGRTKKTRCSSSCSNKVEEKENKSKWRRDKLLTMKFSDSESDVEKEKGRKKTESSDSENSDIIMIPSKNQNRKSIVESDSEIQCLDASSDDSIRVEKYLTTPQGGVQLTSKKLHSKKERVRVLSSDSDSLFQRNKSTRTDMRSESDSDIEQVYNSQGTSGLKGRKNIRRVMEDKQVTSNTKQAAKAEEERIMRIAERQKLYNKLYEARLAGEEKVEKLVLDFNPDTKEELVSVHKHLVRRLKPHQAKGIKFMWDACFESLERIKSSTGSGCVIAHCMGLGKTLQVIALVHTLFSYKTTRVKTVMVICPLSTALNWLNEFKTWLKGVNRGGINLYELSKFKNRHERINQLIQWRRNGGVLIIGYGMFRVLTGTYKNMEKRTKEEITQCLINPGADLVVCDEGHLLKNGDTALSKSIKRIKSLRRIVLTGTPLQNNLLEYHCMIQFVKPNLLGTQKEFMNRFVNPITNGQFDNSTESDVKLMKKRAYVLNKMLKGCVQRFDYSVLTPFLPAKQEYVIFVSLSDVQVKMYQHYLDNFSRPHSGSLFVDFQALQRIWTHPAVMRFNTEKIDKVTEKRASDTEGSLKNFGFVCRASELPNSRNDCNIQGVLNNVGKCLERLVDNTKKKVSVKTEENVKDEGWYLQFIQPQQFEDLRSSAKLVLLFGILEECMKIEDKILIFSQSLYSLTLIETFLKKIDERTKKGMNSEYLNGHSGSWSLGLDYFRLDGQSSAENRSRWCKIFNNPKNTRAKLFLISTRAGGLGINLTAANRVIIFDASWNPSHDVQSIFRVYRYGQKKPCYVYRFLAAGTMEETIYNRQVTKLSLSCRVIDEQQIERHYSNNCLNEFYRFNPNISEQKPELKDPKDEILAKILQKEKKYVENYHEHESLLENKADEKLDEEERKQAWLEYETEKMGNPAQPVNAAPFLPGNLSLQKFEMPVNAAEKNSLFQNYMRKTYSDVYRQMRGNQGQPCAMLTSSTNRFHFIPAPQQPIAMSTIRDTKNNVSNDMVKISLPNMCAHRNVQIANVRSRGITRREDIQILPGKTNTITLPP